MYDNQGWLNIYKPTNTSSFEVLKKIKKKFNLDKIGHAGTLDPLAEGILPIAIGKTTKLISFIYNSKKEYEFEIKWGEQTSTDDREGKIIKKTNHIPDLNEINLKLKDFNGKIFQQPPRASAVKINGVRAYKLLRNDVEFETIKKEVFLFKSQVLEINHNIAKFKIECGKGFYVRSFARDLALKLGTTGHIFSLKRTKVGKFLLNNSILLDDLLKISQRQFGFREIHPSITMLDDILAYEVDDENLINEISQGKIIEIKTNDFTKKSLNSNESLKIFLTYKNSVLSFGKLDGNLFEPQKVLI